MATSFAWNDQEDAAMLTLFSDTQLAVLDRQGFNPKARAHYELFSGALNWSDEVPHPHHPDCRILLVDAYRCLLAYRASLTLGKRREGFRPVWEQVCQHAPGWPGLRPERRGWRAWFTLRRLERISDRELDRHAESRSLDSED